MFQEIINKINSDTIEGNILNHIIKYIISNGSFLISEMSENTGYSLTTTMKYVNSLERDGYIISTGKVQKHIKGRHSVQYSINPDSFYFIGVDIKHSSLSIGIINFIGDMINKRNYENINIQNDHTSLNLICDYILAFIDELENINKNRILDVCINISGRVNSIKGTSASFFNFEEMQSSTLTDILSERIGLKVYIENDTKAMTYGEYNSGLENKYKNLLFVNISWGFALGIIINGELYSGMEGYSGEFGHVNMYNNNIMCHCGKIGCVETEISGSAIYRKFLDRIKKGDISLLSQKLKKNEQIKVQDIIQATVDEDPLAIDIVQQVGLELGHQLAGLINIFNPEAIIIGGSVAQTEAIYFLDPIKLSIRKYSLRLMSQKVKIFTSKLGNEAGLIGACKLARAKIFNKI